jgi:Helix-turn-helix domain/RodZ C-terminal domain
MARGVTLTEVSEATKIRVRYLRALEAEDWDAMPGAAYGRALLRTYATYLGLDADAIVEEYRRIVEPGLAEARPAEWAGAIAPRRRSPWRARWWAAAALATVALGAAAVVVVVAISGGGGKGDGDTTSSASAPSASAPGASAQSGHGHHHNSGQAKPNPPPAPTEASIELRPTGTVWVCLVDHSGRPLLNETLQAGQSRGPFHGPSFELNLGNTQIQIRADGRDIGAPASLNALGYRVTPSGVSPLSANSRPSCA